MQVEFTRSGVLAITDAKIGQRGYVNIDNIRRPTLLTKQGLDDARKRSKWYKNRDEEKGKCDVAKNDFEGMIYKFRDWLREDENEPYIKEDKREELLSELSEHESWLDNATDEIGYKVYEDKFKNLSK